jgi:hypothetical protein
MSLSPKSHQWACTQQVTHRVVHDRHCCDDAAAHVDLRHLVARLRLTIQGWGRGAVVCVFGGGGWEHNGVRFLRPSRLEVTHRAGGMGPLIYVPQPAH